MIRRILLGFSFLAALQTLNAQTYLMDNFGYSNDTLTSNGWGQIGTTATNPIRANGSNLTFTGYVASASGAGATLTNSGQDIFKDISLTAGLNTGSVYVSFMANVSAAQATGDYFFALLPPANTSNFMARTYITSSSTGYYKVAMNRWTEARVFSTDSFAYNQTHLFIVRYDFNTTTSNLDDSVYLYVIKNGSSIPTTVPANPTAFCSGATSNMTGPIIGRVALRQGSATLAPTLTVSGMRFSPTWADGPLPVKWNSFTAKASDNSVLLNWSTSSEKNNQYFMVEKSNDGENFEAIAKVSGNGNSNRVNKYSFTDNDFTTTTAYYRIRQVDFDGKFSFSSTLVVKNEVSPLEVSPNPFNDNLNIAATNSETMISAEIHDIQGKLIQSASGKGNVHMNTSELPNGMYFLRTKQGNTTEVKRIVKK